MPRYFSCHGLLQLALVFATLIGAIGAGHAQVNKKPPPLPVGLEWQAMHDAVIDAKIFPTTANDSEKALMGVVWRKEIAGAYVDKASGRKDPSFVLVGSVKHGTDTYAFSQYFRAGYTPCAPAPNGRSVTQLFPVCPLRVVKFDEAGRSTSKDYPGYCMLFGDSTDNPRAANHTEYADDPKTGIVYFRVIQHGKVVPECNRSLQLGQGF